MRRFVTFPALVAYVLLTAAASLIVSSSSTPALVPTPDAQYAPGNERPAEANCHPYKYPPVELYCYPTDSVFNVTVRGGQIVAASLQTYESGLRLGDVIEQWGEPLRVKRWDNSADLFWSDRYAYVFTAGGFGPFNRVGFISYGKQPSSGVPWRGFTSKGE